MFCVQERKYPEREREEEKEDNSEITYQYQQPRKQLLNKIIANRSISSRQQHQVSLATKDTYDNNQENLNPNIISINDSRSISESGQHLQQRLLKASKLAQEYDAMRGVKPQSNQPTQTLNSQAKQGVGFNGKESFINPQTINSSSDFGDDDTYVNKPHPREFYLKLIETEKKIQKGHFLQPDITFLIEMYTKCIEYFDSVQDPIKCYFEDKISSTLSSTSILSVLMSTQQQQQKQQPLDRTQRSATSKDMAYFDAKKESSQNPEIVHLPPMEKGLHRPRTLSEQKKHDRKKAHYNIEHIKLQKQSDFEKDNLIKVQEKLVQENEQHKQNQISSQNKEIQERLRLRKEKNLIHQSEKLLSNIRNKSDSIGGYSMSNGNYATSGNGDRSMRTLNTNSSQSSDLRITEEDLQFDDRSTKGASDNQTSKFGKSNSQEEIDGDSLGRQNGSQSLSDSDSSSDSSSEASSRTGSQNSMAEVQAEKDYKNENITSEENDKKDENPNLNTNQKETK